MTDELETILNEYAISLHKYSNGIIGHHNDYTKNTTEAKAKLQALINEARCDELKNIWNATQPDIVPSGWVPDTQEALMIYDRLKQLKKVK